MLLMKSVLISESLFCLRIIYVVRIKIPKITRVRIIEVRIIAGKDSKLEFSLGKYTYKV